MTTPTEHLVTDVDFTPAPPELRVLGVLGWVRCVVAGLMVLDGMPLWRTRDGNIALTFPRCEDATKRRHPFLRPVDTAAGEVLVRAIAHALDVDVVDADGADGGNAPQS